MFSYFSSLPCFEYQQNRLQEFFCDSTLKDQACKFLVGKERTLIYGFLPLMKTYSVYLKEKREEEKEVLLFKNENLITNNNRLDVGFLLVWNILNGFYKSRSLQNPEDYFEYTYSLLKQEYELIFGTNVDVEIEEKEEILELLIGRNTSKEKVKKKALKVQTRFEYYYTSFQMDVNHVAWIDYVTAYRKHSFLKKALTSYWNIFRTTLFHPLYRICEQEKEKEEKEEKSKLYLDEMAFQIKDLFSMCADYFPRRLKTYPMSMQIYTYDKGTNSTSFHKQELLKFHYWLPGYIREWIQENILNYNCEKINYDPYGFKYKVIHTFQSKTVYSNLWSIDKTHSLEFIILQKGIGEEEIISVTLNEEPFVIKEDVYMKDYLLDLFATPTELIDEKNRQIWEYLSDIYNNQLFNYFAVLLYASSFMNKRKSRSVCVDEEKKIYQMKEGEYKSRPYLVKEEEGGEILRYFMEREEGQTTYKKTGKVMNSWGHIFEME